MRIACTGTSSTGKTTLAMRVANDPDFAKFDLRYLGTDARAILAERGKRSADDMSAIQRADFQRAYFAKKLSIENDSSSFITDRSFIDVAAYWNEYTGKSDDPFVLGCKKQALRYDLHLYFPHNMLPFEHDGSRSKDVELHERIDTTIVSLLIRWGIVPVIVTKVDLEERLADLLEILSERTR